MQMQGTSGMKYEITPVVERTLHNAITVRWPRVLACMLFIQEYTIRKISPQKTMFYITLASAVVYFLGLPLW